MGPCYDAAMKDWTPIGTVGIALAGLMFMFQSQTQVQFAALQSQIENLGEHIEAIDGRVYEMNERLTRVETFIIESAVQP